MTFWRSNIIILSCIKMQIIYLARKTAWWYLCMPIIWFVCISFFDSIMLVSIMFLVRWPAQNKKLKETGQFGKPCLQKKWEQLSLFHRKYICKAIEIWENHKLAQEQLALTFGLANLYLSVPGSNFLDLCIFSYRGQHGIHNILCMWKISCSYFNEVPRGTGG